MATFTAVRNKKQTAGTMFGVLRYVAQGKKILWDGVPLLTGHNCVPRSSYIEMRTTKERFRKTTGRQFYHFVQSFSADDVLTPLEANAIGLEFAQRQFPEFEVLVATHVDTNHLHNHLVVNSVSCTTGRKLHQNSEDLLLHRKANDEICLAHGLSILEWPEKRGRKKRMKPGEYQAGLIIATGMRRGECCGLKWKDVDGQNHTIHICRNVVKVTGEEIIVKEPKTAAGDRRVYFSPEMASLLKEYRRECDWQADAYENRVLTDDDYIFRKHDSREPMTPSTFTWRFKLILKKHGLPEKLNVHSLRHSHASLLIAGGADVATVAGLLGHSQPSTTLDIYTHAFDKNKKAASEALQKGLDI